MNHRRRRGFTLIELLIVIGIIVVLVGLGFVGYNRVIAAQRTKNTNLAFETLKSMMANYEQTKHLFDRDAYLNPPTPIWWNGNAQAYVPGTPGTSTPPQYDLWDYFEQLPSSTMVPTSLNDGGGATLDVVRNNTLVMEQLLTIPENAKILAALAPDVRHVAQQNWSTTTPYKPGDLVRYTVSGKPEQVWECTTSVSGGSSPDADMAHWRESYSALLDGFGHPIIFVPRQGIEQMFIQNQATTFWLKPPNNRTGWASAGPDGDIRSHDDNIYSFEQ